MLLWGDVWPLVVNFINSPPRLYYNKLLLHNNMHFAHILQLMCRITLLRQTPRTVALRKSDKHQYDDNQI